METDWIRDMEDFVNEYHPGIISVLEHLFIDDWQNLPVSSSHIFVPHIHSVGLMSAPTVVFSHATPTQQIHSAEVDEVEEIASNHRGLFLKSAKTMSTLMIRQI